MKNVIIGTAGHIDHGKTTLVRALTGTDADRLPEEKTRGLTIDIGFAFLDLDNDIRINFIDVPGHERFVKNMLAGATTIDGALLVIAADDGIMPQTREHLAILNLLEIRHIIVVITKCDMVDNEWMEMLREEIENMLVKTIYKGARILPVSSINNNGISELKKAMTDLVSRINNPRTNVTFRLPIDRAFTIPGFGSVVTGSVKNGTISNNDEVELLPMQKIARVRGIEVNGTKSESASVGQRAAINLVGVKLSDIYRGCELSIPGHMEPCQIVDCVLFLHENAKKNLANRARIRFHLFTNEIMGRVILLNKEILKPGEECLAQIILERPIVVERNDRYIIRRYSPSYTIGGGKILRSNTRRLKRFNDKVLNALEILAHNNISDIVELMFIESKPYCLSSKDLQATLNLSNSDIQSVITELLKNNKLINIGTNEAANSKLIHIKTFEKLQAHVETVLKQFHSENPISHGMETTILRSRIDRDLPTDLFSFLISKLSHDKRIKSESKKISLYDFKVKISDIDKKELENVESAMIKGGFTPSPIEEILSKFTKGANKEHISKFLLETGTAVEVSRSIFYHKNIIDQLKRLITDYINKNSSISAAEFRDLTQTSRKYTIPLLEYFDKIHFTKRVEDKRILYGGN